MRRCSSDLFLAWVPTDKLKCFLCFVIHTHTHTPVLKSLHINTHSGWSVTKCTHTYKYRDQFCHYGNWGLAITTVVKCERVYVWEYLSTRTYLFVYINMCLFVYVSVHVWCQDCPLWTHTDISPLNGSFSVFIRYSRSYCRNRLSSTKSTMMRICNICSFFFTDFEVIRYAPCQR